ncbi:MAG: hypothetical protein CUN53_08545 [Phototrophicales bacterium]|nr:MAG: hypothetical protein CUN53_08545 [Phototrophicales bacterium]
MGDGRDTQPDTDSASEPKRVYRARFSAGMVIDPNRLAPPPDNDDFEDTEPAEPAAPERFWTRRRLFYLVIAVILVIALLAQLIPAFFEPPPPPPPLPSMPRV